MHDDNVKLITGTKADLYVFTIDSLNELIDNSSKQDGLKALKIIKSIHDYVHKSNKNIIISKDWDKNTLTVELEPENISRGNHTHLGIIGKGNSFSRLIDDMYNFFCK